MEDAFSVCALCFARRSTTFDRFAQPHKQPSALVVVSSRWMPKATIYKPR